MGFVSPQEDGCPAPIDEVFKIPLRIGCGLAAMRIGDHSFQVLGVLCFQLVLERSDATNGAFREARDSNGAIGREASPGRNWPY